MAALFDRIDHDDLPRAGELCHLRRDQTDRAHAEHDHIVAGADIAVAHAAEGELRRVIAHDLLPGHPLRNGKLLARAEGVRRLERTVTRDALPDLIAFHARTDLADRADPHIAGAHEEGLLRRLLARAEELILFVKYIFQERVLSAEVRKFGAVLRGGELDLRAHLPLLQRRILIGADLALARLQRYDFFQHN